jgi:dihydroxyacetone kinase
LVAKHLINEPDALVVEGLRGLLRTNPELSLIEHEKGTALARVTNGSFAIVVFRTPDTEKVTLLSGGRPPSFAVLIGRWKWP